jgi:hypothetical protein
MGRVFKILVLVLICLSWINDSKAQENNDLIQLSGVTISRDSLFPVPFTTVMVKNANRGTTSDFYGYFSFVAKKGDTLIFSSIGYKEAKFVVSDSLRGDRYSLIQTLSRDTIELETVNIYPWPTAEQFKEAFLNLDIPDDDLEIARKNLDPEVMEDRLENMPMSANMNFKFQNQQRANALYYAGQSRINNLSNLLNPIAWAKFIEAWKNGDFKRKE